MKFTNLIRKLFTETIWDMLKDNLKLSLFVFTTSITVGITSMLEPLKRTVSVPIWLLVSILIIVLYVVIFFIYDSLNNKLSYDPNVEKFSKGDEVILKLQSNVHSPKRLIVFDIRKTVIVCKDSDNSISEHAPHELLIREETIQAIQNVRNTIAQRNAKNIKQIQQISYGINRRGF